MMMNQNQQGQHGRYRYRGNGDQQGYPMQQDGGGWGGDRARRLQSRYGQPAPAQPESGDSPGFAYARQNQGGDGGETPFMQSSLRQNDPFGQHGGGGWASPGWDEQPDQPAQPTYAESNQPGPGAGAGMYSTPQQQSTPQVTENRQPSPYQSTPTVSATTAQPQPPAAQPAQQPTSQPSSSSSTGGSGGWASPFGNMKTSGTPSAMAHGGVATHPTEAIVGEHGKPERIMRMGRYGGGMPSLRGDGASVPGNEPGGAHGRYGGMSHMHGQEPNSALSRAIERDAEGGVISKPTRIMLEPGEAVVPLDGHAGSKITPGMVQPRRYRMTGPAMTHHPIGTMPPAMLDKRMG